MPQNIIQQIYLNKYIARNILQQIYCSKYNATNIMHERHYLHSMYQRPPLLRIELPTIDCHSNVWREERRNSRNRSVATWNGINSNQLLLTSSTYYIIYLSMYLFFSISISHNRTFATCPLSATFHRKSSQCSFHSWQSFTPYLHDVKPYRPGHSVFYSRLNTWLEHVYGVTICITFTLLTYICSIYLILPESKLNCKDSLSLVFAHLLSVKTHLFMLLQAELFMYALCTVHHWFYALFMVMFVFVTCNSCHCWFPPLDEYREIEAN